jgi:hypothetical protein
MANVSRCQPLENVEATILIYFAEYAIVRSRIMIMACVLFYEKWVRFTSRRLASTCMRPHGDSCSST